MPLTKEVTAPNAEANKEGGVIVTFRLQCWTEPEKTNLVIDQTFQAYVKAAVAGKTKNDLIQEAGTKVQAEMQVVINQYLAKQAVLASAKLATVVSAIQAGLTG